jgi:hypothetical protein
MKENDILLADFVEWKKYETFSYFTPFYQNYLSRDGLADTSIFHQNSLKFNSSWDWLMIVVEKIESIKDEHHGYFGVYINSNSCSIQGTNLKTDVKQIPPIYYSNFVLNNKLQATYQAVVEFVKWYNENK